MRTDARRAAGVVALVLFLVSGAARADAWWSHLEVGLWPEVTLVGLSGGARAELAYRPGRVGTASRIRLAPGVLGGPEFTYVPVALGYRAIFRSAAIVQPILGTGLEFQYRWVSETDARQLAWYGEVGVQFAPRPDLAVGVVASLDWAFAGPPGAGLVLRAGVTWSPGARTPPAALASRR